MNHDKQPQRFNAAQSAGSLATAGMPPLPQPSFTRWVWKLLQRDTDAHREITEEFKVDQLKRQMIAAMEPFMFAMSRRDMQIYLRVLSATRCDSLRHLRFEYFDMLCRMLTESAAMEHLLQVDALLDL